MRVAVFDIHNFERKPLEEANRKFGHELTYFEPRLTPQTAVLAKSFSCVCSFANDRVNKESLEILYAGGTRLIALRSAGFNHVDIVAAVELGISVVRVPEYSPYAVAEHATALLLSLNRKIPKAHTRVHELNFSLDGLVGFDLHGKTVGIIGVGRIGSVMAQIMRGFGCRVLLNDLNPNAELAAGIGARFVDLPEIYLESDIVSLHVPLTPETRYLIGTRALGQMKKGVYLINTGRGALVDSRALIQALKSGHVGGAGLDVYEEEENVFFHNLSDQILQDDVLARLLTFPNVIITAHQAFLTEEALSNIAETTLQNIYDFENERPLKNQVGPEKVRAAA